MTMRGLTDNPDVVHIRPGLVRRWLLPAMLPAVAAFLLLAGVWALLGPNLAAELAGPTLAGVFGFGVLLTVFTVIAAIRVALGQPPVTLVLGPLGLTLLASPGPGTIPWEDVETIGTVPDDWIGRTVGLRLTMHERFLESLSETARRSLQPPLDVIRARRGYEVQIARRLMDRPVEEFVELLYGYWEEYGKGSFSEGD